jgi:hypothetical protein
MGVKLGHSLCGRNIGWRVFENRGLRNTFGSAEIYIMRSLMIRTPHEISRLISARMRWSGHMANTVDRIST